MEDPRTVKRELAEVLNRNSVDAFAETPDFILAEMLWDAIVMYRRARVADDRFHGRRPPAEVF